MVGLSQRAQHAEHLERAPQRARQAGLERVQREQRQGREHAELHEPLQDVDVADEEVAALDVARAALQLTQDGKADVITVKK